jgi:phosphoserine phosphatase
VTAAGLPQRPPATAVRLTVSGPDRPGVTAALFTRLADLDVAVLDLEQVVVRGHLVLGVLVSADGDGAAIAAAATAVGEALGMAVEVALTDDEPDVEPPRVAVTVLGAPLRPAAVAELAATLAGLGANIDRIRRLASYPVTSVQLDVTGSDPAELRRALAAASSRIGVDVAVEPGGLLRRAKRLVVMDVDSTLIQGEVIEMLAARAGVEERVRAVTEAAMAGELDFEASLRARVALLGGLPASVLEDVRDEVRLTPGARTLVRTLKRLDYRFAIVSGGFTQVTDHLVAELDIDYSAANTLEIVDGRLTGGLVGPVVDRPGKAAALRRFAADAGVPLSQTVAVGDGANDLDMLEAAGLGIAFNAKPVVRQAADASVTVPYLDPILYLLGISRPEIEAADALDGVVTPSPRLDGSAAEGRDPSPAGGQEGDGQNAGGRPS